MQEAAAFELTQADYEVTVEVWPDNWQAVKVFNDVGTQWRMGPNGPSGLDYTGVRTAFEFMDDLPREQWSEMFGYIQIMELAALKTIHGIKDED